MIEKFGESAGESDFVTLLTDVIVCTHLQVEDCQVVL